MSDLRLVPSVEIKNAGTKLAGWINANAVLQKILQNLAAEDRNKIILRCDDLPLISGNEEEFENLFRGLLQLILQKKNEVATLFLHISCVTDPQATSAAFGTHYFTIQFNTNIVPCSNWFEQNKNYLDKLSALVAECKGKLVFNAFKSSGCIFSVSLPGKAV